MDKCKDCGHATELQIVCEQCGHRKAIGDNDQLQHSQEGLSPKLEEIWIWNL